LRALHSYVRAMIPAALAEFGAGMTAGNIMAPGGFLVWCVAMLAERRALNPVVLRSV